MLVHYLTSFELGVVEVDDTSRFSSANSHSEKVHQAKNTTETHALTRTTSFSSVISVYLPCSFCCISLTRSILHVHNQDVSFTPGIGKHLTPVEGLASHAPSWPRYCCSRSPLPARRRGHLGLHHHPLNVGGG